MRYYELTINGYILSFGVSDIGGKTITEERYEEIKKAMKEMPKRTGTIAYRLTEKLSWEAYEVEPPDPDPDIDDAELLNILIGGAE